MLYLGLVALAAIAVFGYTSFQNHGDSKPADNTVAPTSSTLGTGLPGFCSGIVELRQLTEGAKYANAVRSLTAIQASFEEANTLIGNLSDIAPSSLQVPMQQLSIDAHDLNEVVQHSHSYRTAARRIEGLLDPVLRRNAPLAVSIDQQCKPYFPTTTTVPSSTSTSGGTGRNGGHPPSTSG